MRASQPQDAESPTVAPEMLLEYVTIPGCADCRRFERLLEQVAPDFPEVEVREVAGETPRGMAISVERGVLRFPVIVLDDKVIGIESIEESVLRMALAARRNER
jgi:glutaredoxin